MIVRYAAKAWHSPTLNTWASFLARSLGHVLVLPLVLRQFSTEEFNVWALCTTMLGLQLLVDMGFCATFVRAIAFGLAGARSVEEFGKTGFERRETPNWELVMRVAGTMRFIYSVLGLLFLAALALGGTAVLLRPIGLTQNPLICWGAWIIVVISGYANFRANYLGVLLQGLNEIALVRRWQALTTLGSVLSGFLVLWAGGNILVFMAVTQAWSAVAIFRNHWLCRRVAGGRFANFPPATRDREMFRALWSPTWRSGIGVLMSFGLVQSTGLINAQFATAGQSASYLMGLKLIQLISSFSQAPFYSKLALLPRLRGEGRHDDMMRVAERGMRLSLWVYVGGFVSLGLVGPTAFALIGSNVNYPTSSLWLVLGVTFFLERYGAMHLNLYSTTNRIIAHIANGITGLICVVAMLVFVQWFGVIGLPLGLFAGYLAFYSWYPAMHSYREFGMPFLRFELRTTGGPALGVLTYGVYAVSQGIN